MKEHILKNMKKIAIIGLSPDPTKPSYKVAKYLQEQGFKIFPLYPKEERILNEKVYRSLDELDEVDTAVMFRKGEVAKELYPLIKAKNIPHFWLQLGIKNDEVKALCEEEGRAFVQDACIMVELQKLRGLR